MKLKRVVLALAIAAVLASTASNAYASWTSPATGNGRSTSLSVTLPTNRTATGTSASVIDVSWNAPAAPSANPTQYVVRRKAPTTATVCTVTGATFACDDTGLSTNTTYTYTIEARVGTSWTTGESPTFTGTTTTLPTFIVTPAAGTHQAGTPFNVTLTATTNGSTTDTSYTGSHVITFSGPSNSPGGDAPTYPTTVTFVNGVGTASITLVAAQTVSLQATDGTRSGTGSISETAGAASKLVYTNSSQSCASGSVIVGNGGSFTSFVTQFDAYRNTVPAAAAAPIALTKSPAATGTLVPTSLTIAVGASQTSGSFTFTLPVGNPPDTTVTASSGSLTPAACTVRKN